MLVPKTWQREPTSKCLDTDNQGSDNQEPTVLDDIDVETSMNEDGFQIDMESQDGLQGLKQENLALKDEGKLVALERQGALAGR